MSRTTARGYGAEHQRIRKALLPYAYGARCVHCGELMLPGQALDLDHTRDRLAYRGFSHAKCNRGEASRIAKDNRQRSRRSRDW